MNRRRLMTIEQAWADRLGIESPELVGELTARFEHLSRFVLCGGMPPHGKAGLLQASAEGAAAYGELWLLDGFLTEARRALAGEGVEW